MFKALTSLLDRCRGGAHAWPHGSKGHSKLKALMLRRDCPSQALSHLGSWQLHCDRAARWALNVPHGLVYPSPQPPDPECCGQVAWAVPHGRFHVMSTFLIFLVIINEWFETEWTNMCS